MPLTDKDVGNAALAGDFFEGVLEFCTVLCTALALDVSSNIVLGIFKEEQRAKLETQRSNSEQRKEEG